MGERTIIVLDLLQPWPLVVVAGLLIFAAGLFVGAALKGWGR